MDRTFVFALLVSLGACTRPELSRGEASEDSAPEVFEPTQVVTAPGQVRWVQFRAPPGWGDAQLQCRDLVIKHSALQAETERFAYVAESYFSDLSPHACKLVKAGEAREVAAFKVESFRFKEEQLKVDSRKVSLSPKDADRAAREQKLLNELYKQSAPTPYFSAPFQVPLKSAITSVYGIRRVYNKQHKGQHLGTDFRAAVGVPVPASNRGRVMFAGDLFFTGGTVIIDHGMDIFSVYGHLSEVKVQAGQIVSSGDLVGLSGNTGRSSGPHLHWGIKIHGHYVDGFSLIEETKKQFP